jgi:hypothetical protein
MLIKCFFEDDASSHWKLETQDCNNEVPANGGNKLIDQCSPWISAKPFKPNDSIEGRYNNQRQKYRHNEGNIFGKIVTLLSGAHHISFIQHFQKFTK